MRTSRVQKMSLLAEFKIEISISAPLQKRFDVIDPDHKLNPFGGFVKFAQIEFCRAKRDADAPWRSRGRLIDPLLRESKIVTVKRRRDIPSATAITAQLFNELINHAMRLHGKNFSHSQA